MFQEVSATSVHHTSRTTPPTDMGPEQPAPNSVRWAAWQVKPKVEVVTYHCETCGSEIFQSVDGADDGLRAGDIGGWTTWKTTHDWSPIGRRPCGVLFFVEGFSGLIDGVWQQICVLSGA